MVVPLVQQQPVLLAPTIGLATSDEHDLAPELGPVELGVQLAGTQLRRRVAALVRLPGAPVPHDDVAAAVLAGGDDALEVHVLQRMVLHVHPPPASARVEGGPARHGPADQYTA